MDHRFYDGVSAVQLGYDCVGDSGGFLFVAVRRRLSAHVLRLSAPLKAVRPRGNGGVRVPAVSARTSHSTAHQHVYSQVVRLLLPRRRCGVHGGRGRDVPGVWFEK